MGGYAKFVIGLLVIGLIVYFIATVNFKEAISFDFLKVFQVPGPAPEETVKIGGGPVGVEIRKPETPSEDVVPPTGFTASQLSPFYRQVRISGVSRGFDFSDISSVSFSASNLEESVNITGWTVRSNKGTVLAVPKGIGDYNPVSPVVEKDIIFNAGDSVDIYNTVTSFGFDLRLNKCTGYLNNLYAFKPDLPNSCPSFDRSDFASFSGRCQSFIYSLGGCRQPTTSELNELSRESACIGFLNNVNYGGCYRAHRFDADFFSREWRVSLGSDFNFLNLDSQHDRILLFDRSGLLVDEHIY